jgi:hypothetical protein
VLAMPSPARRAWSHKKASTRLDWRPNAMAVLVQSFS